MDRPASPRRRAGLLTLVCAGVVLLAPALAAATPPGADGDLAEACFDSICISDPYEEGAAVTRLSLGLREVEAVAWSPDGTRLAFSARVGTESYSSIHVVNRDGTGYKRLTTPSQAADGYPAWSPDSSRVAFVRDPDCGSPRGCSPVQIRVTSAATGGAGTVAYSEDNVISMTDLDWSPDGERFAVVIGVVEGEANFHERAAVITDGDKQAIGAATPLGPESSSPGSRLSWSPDARRLAYAARDSAEVRLFAPGGAGLGRVTLDDGAETPAVEFAPEGSHLLITGCQPSSFDCSLRRVQSPPPGAAIDYDPAEPQQQVLPSGGGRSLSMQPQQQPIIFLHGFAGARIKCGDDELWPPTIGDMRADVLNMRLAEDGASALPGTCGAGPSEIVSRAFGTPVYSGTVSFLEDIAPDHHHIFVWDWRKDPRGALLALQAQIGAALDADLQKRQGVDEVVLAGHSMGGLVMRAAVRVPEIAERVARAVTIGTPYWGSPKAIFPVAAGVEAPEFGTLDILLPNDAFRSFASNLTGMYFLYPSESYGPWLTVTGRHPGFLTRDQLLAYVGGPLGGNAGLLGKALDTHRDELDGFPEGEFEWRAFVGRGEATIGTVALHPGTGGEAGSTDITWVDGDGTVPARSAVQGPVGTDDPLGRNVRISYVCHVTHVPLPGHEKVTGPLKDFLRYGTPPLRPPAENCQVSADEVQFDGIELPPEDGARRARAMPLAEAVGLDLVQLVETPDRPVAVLNRSRPVDVGVQATDARLAVTPVTDGARGTPRFYGPVTGELGLRMGADGTLAVLDDGVPVVARDAAEPGDPVPGTPAASPPPPPPPPGPGPVDPGPPGPGPGPVPGPGPGPGVADRDAPGLSGLKVTRRGGRVTLRLRLSEAARVTVRVERAMRGRRKGGRCVAGGTGRRCTRYAKVRTVRRDAEPGTSRVKLGGRLKEGAYRILVTAADAGGNRSAKRTLKVRIV